MFKKIICAFLVFSLIIITFGGCGKPVETLKVDKETSKSNFTVYKQKIKDILDKTDVKYNYSEMETGNEDDAKDTDPYMLIMKFEMQTGLQEALFISLTNTYETESFNISFGLNKEKINDCNLNIREYLYIRNIFNLVSEIKVSSFACNRLLTSTQKGIEAEFEANPDAFYKKENKYFGRDESKTWFLQYTIYYKTAADPAIFEETLSFHGNLAPQTAD